MDNFWNIQASDLIPEASNAISLIIAVGILLLAYGLIRGVRNYANVRTQMSAIVLISGVLAILVYLGSSKAIGEDGLIGILGSLIGYVLGSIRQQGPVGEKGTTSTSSDKPGDIASGPSAG